MSDKLIFNGTHGKEDPERATLPFVAANIAATAGQEAIVLCTIEAVWVGTDRTARVIVASHAFAQNLRRGFYDLGTDVPSASGLPDAFDELALAI